MELKERLGCDERQFLDNNKVGLCGIIAEEFIYSHDCFWEEFFKTRIKVIRKSGEADFIPIIVSNLLVPRYEIETKLFKGKLVEIVGQVRTRNRTDENRKRHLDVFIFVTAIRMYDEYVGEYSNLNLVYLKGYLCKPPVFKVTPLGRRIADLHVAVNGLNGKGKSAYIPVITWGRNAVWSACFEIGTQVELYGRMQSRKYIQRINGNEEMRTAYEVSASLIQEVIAE